MPKILKKREIQLRAIFLEHSFPTKGKISIFASKEIKRLAKQTDPKTIEWMKKWVSDRVPDKKQRKKLSEYLETMKKGGKPRWKGRAKDERMFVEANIKTIYNELRKCDKLSPWAVSTVRDYYRLGKISKQDVKSIVTWVKDRKQKERIKRMLKI